MASRRVWWRSSLRFALGAIGLFTLLVALVEGAVLLRSPVEPHWIILMLPGVGLAAVATGLVAWDRRPSNRLGVLLVATGVAWLTAGLANTGLPAPTALGQVVATLPLALTIHTLLAFPEGRVNGRAARLVVGAAYVVALVLQAPLYLFATAVPPFDVLAIGEDAEVARVAEDLQRLAGTAVALAATWVLVRRAARASPGQRRVLVPVSVYGIFAVLFAILSGNLLEPILQLDPIDRMAVQLAFLAGVPVAFAAGLLLGRFGRAGEVAELAASLDDGPEGGQWTATLAATLRDPTVRVLFWLPERRTYADIDGHPTELADPGSGRAVSPIAIAGTRVGALEYDPLINPDPEVVVEACELIAFILERQRLTVALRESRRSLSASRAQLVVATDQERRRIAQDLHDGVQASLLGLALRVSRLSRELAGDDEAVRAAGQIESGIMGCADELRLLVHGIMPSLLIERGLFAAIDDLVDSLPVPTEVELAGDDAELPDAVQSAVYFTVAEALANAVKHAQAASLSVSVRCRPTDLLVEVRDDGVGGAAPDGMGIRSITDRVEVVGGTLLLDSPRGRGTSLVVEVPCRS